MDTNIKAYKQFWDLYNNNINFNLIVKRGMEQGKIRFFNENEWDKIRSQNFFPFESEMKEFIDMFTLGYNIGNCVGTARQLSYSYNDVDIVSGILPILKGTLNATEEGGHCWLETKDNIIDTTLMLVIDKELKKDFGYIEEQRITSYQLRQMHTYMARKELVNDKSLNRRSQKK